MQVTVKVAIAFNNAVRGAKKEGVSCLEVWRCELKEEGGLLFIEAECTIVKKSGVYVRKLSRLRP